MCIRSIFSTQILSVVVAKWWFLGFVVRDRTFMRSVFTATLTLMTGFLSVYYHLWRAGWGSRASFLFVSNFNGHHQYSGCVLRPRTIMELQPLTSQLSPVTISWLSAQPMHVVEHLTSWWLMFLTLYGLLLWHRLVTHIIPISVRSHYDGSSGSKHVC